MWSPISATCWDWELLIARQVGEQHQRLTPFMRGMREAGSVDIEASSKKITGKSMASNDRDPELMQVVHT